jgi:hypothetical protein
LQCGCAFEFLETLECKGILVLGLDFTFWSGIFDFKALERLEVLQSQKKKRFKEEIFIWKKN